MISIGPVSMSGRTRCQTHHGGDDVVPCRPRRCPRPARPPGAAAVVRALVRVPPSDRTVPRGRPSVRRRHTRAPSEMCSPWRRTVAASVRCPARSARSTRSSGSARCHHSPAAASAAARRSVTAAASSRRGFQSARFRVLRGITPEATHGPFHGSEGVFDTVAGPPVGDGDRGDETDQRPDEGVQDAVRHEAAGLLVSGELADQQGHRGDTDAAEPVVAPISASAPKLRTRQQTTRANRPAWATGATAAKTSTPARLPRSAGRHGAR